MPFQIKYISGKEGEVNCCIPDLNISVFFQGKVFYTINTKTGMIIENSFPNSPVAYKGNAIGSLPAGMSMQYTKPSSEDIKFIYDYLYY